METKAFSELFPIFSNAQPETLDWFLSIVEEEEYPQEQTILTEESWGTAVYFIVSGWVKLKRIDKEKAITLEIIGRGDFFGEVAILDESPRLTEVVTLSSVKLLSISAQRFIQMLLKDSQLQHRVLQLMVRRVRHLNTRFQLRHHSPAMKLTQTLIFLAEQYGQHTEKGKEIYQIPDRDLADVADVSLEETSKIMEKLQRKGWVEIDRENRTLSLTNLKQLSHLALQI
ncbi:MAG: Crp/Fnr family transcriptional regulator [Prochloraceae cyanobacterium]|nr:Crp/Fnr family transcriptional regulator [Prochloraceae cyanobacterium]